MDIEERASRTKQKIAWVTSSPTPYKLPFFSMLAAEEDIEFKMFFLTWASPTRSWALESEAGFDYEVLPGLNVRTSFRRKTYLRFNASVVSRIRKGNWDRVVISGYNHPTMLMAILTCWLRRIPFIVQGESHLLKPRSRLISFLKRLFIFPLCRKCSAAFATGTLAKKYWEYVGIPSDRIFIVANTPDIDWFRNKANKAREAKARHTDKQLKTGIFIGRFIEAKGLDIMMEGLSLIDPEQRPSLLLVGEGPLEEQLKGFVDEHDLPVQFLPFMQKEKLPALYVSADLLVLPSRKEPWGVVVNEAMACGLPVMLSDKVGAAYDLLRDGKNGFLVSPNDSEHWAQQLENIARMSQEDMERLGEVSTVITADWRYENSLEQFFLAIGLEYGNCSSE